MTETERELLRAILEDIDCDTPRLVYADFLEERVDPRSEFIRCHAKPTTDVVFRGSVVCRGGNWPKTSTGRRLGYNFIRCSNLIESEVDHA
jgi:uncharacterized protein (TIGR02996 family)